MIKKIVLGFVAVLVLFLGYAALKPGDYAVSREISILASPDKIFPYLNNAKLMHAWNPWTRMDQKAVLSYSGPTEGVGARTNWEGGDQLGTGSATVSESIPNQKVVTKLEYLKPFEMTQYAELSIKPAAGGSIVVWSVQGKNNFMGRVMCLFMNMDKMVGGTFEKGLLSLKEIVEKGATR